MDTATSRVPSQQSWIEPRSMAVPVRHVAQPLQRVPEISALPNRRAGTPVTGTASRIHQHPMDRPIFRCVRCHRRTPRASVHWHDFFTCHQGKYGIYLEYGGQKNQVPHPEGCPGVADIYSPRSGSAAMVSTRDRPPCSLQSGGGATSSSPVR